MSDKFILNDQGQPIPEPDLIKWGRWLQRNDTQRIVKQENIGDVKVSTVFLGLDHSWTGGPPVLWETMVFGSALDQPMDRCSGNREQAEAMHAKMVKRVKESK